MGIQKAISDFGEDVKHSDVLNRLYVLTAGVGFLSDTSLSSIKGLIW